jgi:hypothetical protein
MNRLQRRLREADKRIRGDEPSEPQFIHWIGDPWTPEEEALAKRRYPNGRLFWRPLVPGKDTDPVIRSTVWPPAEPVE